MFFANIDKMAVLSDYYVDLQTQSLPQVVFLESASQGSPSSDEHPPSDFQVGQASVVERINALLNT
jgi:phosphoesterase family protein